VIARSDGSFWRETYWRNWRRRVFRPAAERAGLPRARPYDLRHAFASLLIAEGRLSIVEIAAQLGHNPTVCLDIYGHELAERTGARGLSAEDRIWLARKETGL
jgi:integrase